MTTEIQIIVGDVVSRFGKTKSIWPFTESSRIVSEFCFHKLHLFDNGGEVGLYGTVIGPILKVRVHNNGNRSQYRNHHNNNQELNNSEATLLMCGVEFVICIDQTGYSLVQPHHELLTL